MPHMQIKHRWTDAVLYEGNFGTLPQCVESAYQERASLRGADLIGAVLSGAVLSGADLRGADLSDADLHGADLRGASLRGADLRVASLRGAILRGAFLRGGVKLRALRKECSRTDGYEFRLWDCEDSIWRITAGCRFFTLPEAWDHWTRTRDNTPLGEETFDILVMFEHQAERDDAARRT